MTNEWSIAIEGASVFALPEAKRWAKIVEPSPSYEIDEGATNPEKTKPKLIINVIDSLGRKAQYYPNRTSARFIASKLQTDLTNESMKKWVGQTIYWGKILDMMIAGQTKKVLYVTDVKLIA